MTDAPTSRTCLLASLAVAALAVSGCKPRDGGAAGGSGRSSIQTRGSDTMVNVAQGWAEEYKKINKTVDIEVSGGGSGVGIAALIKGTIHIAASSRDMKAEEKALAKRNTGQEPKEFIVGFDALAIYVHKDNPLTEITNEQLAAIFAEGGRITKWSDLGVKLPSGQDQIVRISRQSSSGTYEFFREHVLDKKDFKLGSRDMNGSKEVVELVATTPSAIGYSGLGYNEPGKVRMLKVAAKPGQPAVAPSIEATLSKEYPIARALLLYTLGEPSGAVKEYLDWIMSNAGQQVVERTGYVPLPASARTK